jgi:hypothetical protein
MLAFAGCREDGAYVLSRHGRRWAVMMSKKKPGATKAACTLQQHTSVRLQPPVLEVHSHASTGTNSVKD